MSLTSPWKEDIDNPNVVLPDLKASVELWFNAGNLHKNRRNIPTRRRQQGDENPKEKSPWRAITNRTGGNQPSSQTIEHWRPVELNLNDKECKLSVISEDNTLLYSIHVNKLEFTDIRRVDRSLSGRSRTLVLYCSSGVGIQCQGGKKQPIFLSFPSNALLEQWTKLLRLLSLSKHTGTDTERSYRISRSIQLDLVQATLFGISRDTIANDQENQSEGSNSKMKCFCEILINSEYAGVTTSQRCHHRTFSWHQSFTFTELPELLSIQINLRREKGVEESNLLGTCFLDAQHWRRGVQHGGHLAICEFRPTLDGHRVALGEVKYKCKLEEVVILPYTHYEDFEKTLHGGGIFKVLHDAEVGFRIQDRVTDLFEPMVSLCIARGSLLTEIQNQAYNEVHDFNSAQNSLFRGTSPLSRVVGLALKQYGQDWLDSSIGGPIREICENRISIRMEESSSLKGPKNQEHQAKTLTDWCDRIWGSIWQAAEECPSQLRMIFSHIKQSVEERFGTSRPNYHWQIVAAFVFLRFFVAAIIDPQIWAPLPLTVQQSLKSVGKVLQLLANLNQNVRKDYYGKRVERFLEDNISSMRDYLNLVSTPKVEEHRVPRSSGYQETAVDSKLSMMHSILQQEKNRSNLACEAAGSLPFLIDVPQNVATIASILAEHCRKLDPETFNKRGVLLSPDSLQRLAKLVWQALVIRDRTLHYLERHLASKPKDFHHFDKARFESTLAVEGQHLDHSY